MVTQRMNINGSNRNRVDETVNPNSAHKSNNSTYSRRNTTGVGNPNEYNQNGYNPNGYNQNGYNQSGQSLKPRMEQPKTEAERKQYLEMQRKYSSRQEQKDKDYKPTRRMDVRGQVKDRTEKEDTLFKILKENIFAIEEIFGFNEKAPNGKKVKDLPYKEFHERLVKDLKSMSIVRKAKILQETSAHLAHIQTCLSYMEYYKIAKIKLSVLDCANDMCKVIDGFKTEESVGTAYRQLNIVLHGLHRNDMKGKMAVNVPAYRVIRLLCVYVMYKDLVSASIIAKLIFNQAILEQEIMKEEREGRGNKHVRQG